MKTTASYSCPKCGAALQTHDASGDFSLGGHVALQLIGWPVFVLVLYALHAYGVGGVFVASVAASGVSAFVMWRIVRARAANQPERYSCPKCLRVFAGGELRSSVSSYGSHAP